MAGEGEGGAAAGGLSPVDPSIRYRAPFAADPRRSRGRRFAEPASPTRTPFQRDRDRIVHATAFRRLKDKTQVFLYDEGDHYRTRLTHSLEVAQVARSLARALGLDEDLTEAVALAHDLGHPPFGHAGERALDAAMRPFGGFDHNDQAWRVVTRLERRYPRFDGLNLSWEVLEGIVKHNGPLTDADDRPLPRHRAAVTVLAEAAAPDWDLWLWSQPGLEAQAAAIADDIAYDAHDIDDGLRAGLLTLEGLAAVPLLSDLLSAVAREHPGLERPRLVHELQRRLITAMIEDVILESRRRIAAAAPADADAVRRAGGPLVGFSAAMAAADAAIKAELTRRVYRHRQVMEVMGAAEAAVGRLFARYRDDPEALPPEWRPPAGPADPAALARRIGDFLAGMTDRFAIGEYRRLFD